MPEAFVGLGSNLAQPVEQVRTALEALGRIPHTCVITASSLYRSAPLGPADQPDYVNSVAHLQTELGPHALLDSLQAIEADQGRVRGPLRWGPRTLDLDLLLYGGLSLCDRRLTVPHPGLRQRAFVLYPLADIAPALTLPDGTPIARLLEELPSADLERFVETGPKTA